MELIETTLRAGTEYKKLNVTFQLTSEEYEAYMEAVQDYGSAAAFISNAVRDLLENTSYLDSWS